jgi:hypothetical protein
LEPSYQKRQGPRKPLLYPNLNKVLAERLKRHFIWSAKNARTIDEFSKNWWSIKKELEMQQKLSSLEKTALEDFLMTFHDELEFYLGGRGTSLTESLHHIYICSNPKGINIGLQRY